MRIFRFASLTVFFAALICTTAFADVSIETSVSRESVPVGDQLTLDIIVSNADGRIENPKISSIDGFTAYSQGHSQEISIINGQSSSRSVFSYVLVANSVGEKTIGPIEIQIGGKEYKVAPVKVEVTQGSPAPSSQGASPYSWTQGPVSSPSPRALPTGNVGDQDIFVKAWLDKDEVYVNEPAMLAYTLFTRLSATYKGFDKEPVTTGFWVEDFPPDKTIRKTEKIINGSRYVVADVRKLALFPTQAGVYTVDPGVLSASVEVRSEDTFDSFFSGGIFGRRTFPSSFVSQVMPKVLPALPVTLTVKTLPENGKPAGFNGAVGDYGMESSLDKNEAEVGSPVTFKVKIRGQGNINTIQTPSLPRMDDFKVYDSSSSTNVSKERLIVEGEKVTETVIVPKKPGTFTIPPLNFSYFNPKTQSYKELATPAQTLTVKPASEIEAAPPPDTSAGVPAAPKEDVSILAKDIRYIKTIDDGKIIPARELYKNPAYWAVNGVLLALWVLLMIFSAVKESASKDAKAFRFRRSHAAARRRLKAASRLMKEEKKDEFYAEVSKSLYGYFADKLNVSAQTVSIQTVEIRTGDGISPELLNRIRSLFDELSMGRFARAEKTKEEMRNVFQKADEIITAFEKLKLK